MAASPLDQAKLIACDGLTFQIAAESGVFPPRDVANAFFECGRDDLPGEGVLEWRPFTLSEGEYHSLLSWWRQTHPEARVDRLGVQGADFSRWFAAAVGRKPHDPDAIFRGHPPFLLVLFLAVFGVSWTIWGAVVLLTGEYSTRRQRWAPPNVTPESRPLMYWTGVVSAFLIGAIFIWLAIALHRSVRRSRPPGDRRA